MVVYIVKIWNIGEKRTYIYEVYKTEELAEKIEKDLNAMFTVEKQKKVAFSECYPVRE